MELLWIAGGFVLAILLLKFGVKLPFSQPVASTSSPADPAVPFKDGSPEKQTLAFLRWSFNVRTGQAKLDEADKRYLAQIKLEVEDLLKLP